MVAALESLPKPEVRLVRPHPETYSQYFWLGQRAGRRAGGDSVAGRVGSCRSCHAGRRALSPPWRVLGVRRARRTRCCCRLLGRQRRGGSRPAPEPGWRPRVGEPDRAGARPLQTRPAASRGRRRRRVGERSPGRDPQDRYEAGPRRHRDDELERRDASLPHARPAPGRASNAIGELRCSRAEAASGQRRRRSLESRACSARLRSRGTNVAARPARGQRKRSRGHLA